MLHFFGFPLDAPCLFCLLYACTRVLFGGGEDMHRFPVRSPRMDRGDLMSSPAARQIYLTFPADSTFSEEDVSNYFRYLFLPSPGSPIHSWTKSIY